ncbi:hypothetical protein [Allokutzneria albata]|uniref:hypothetical protein n=1 Tax=Allokutzneria albata TaxID=211114 RepID=UPI0004C30127|nr:hypothetical protein [Allokutzneria albata]
MSLQQGEVAEAFAGIGALFLAGAVPETVRQAVTLTRQGGAERVAVLSSHGPEVEIEFGPESARAMAESTLTSQVINPAASAWACNRGTSLRPFGQRAFPGFHTGT